MSKKHYLLLSFSLALFLTASGQVPGGFYTPTLEEGRKVKEKEGKAIEFLDLHHFRAVEDSVPAYFQLPAPENGDTSTISVPEQVNGRQGSTGRRKKGVAELH